MFDFLRSYFTIKRADDLNYQKAQILSLGKGKNLNVPEHWVKERDFLPEEREFKVAFHRNSKPISVFIPKNIQREKIGMSVKKMIASKLYYHILKHNLHTERVFRYDSEKDTFIPCTFVL